MAAFWGNFCYNPAMNKSRIFKLLFLLIFLISSGLRLGLVLVDRDSNAVIDIILRQNRLPVTNECEECFQPKLYYYFAAKAIEIGNINLNHKGSIALALQLMNFAAGEAVIVLAYLLIKDLDAHFEHVGVIAFALAAFNPALMATSSWTENDTFAILFSSIAIYIFWKYLRTNGVGWLAVSGLFVSISLATKTNTWSTALAIILILLVKALSDRRLFNTLAVVIFTLAVPLLTLLNPLSQYWTNIRQFGTPITLNVPPEPFPSLFEKTYVRRPGIISIQDGFFTFKFLDLLRSPRLTLGATDYNPFRTSFWADIYGTANSLHFFNSPDSWHTRPDFETTRSIFVLALLPTVLLVLGCILGWVDLLKSLISRSGDLLRQRHFGLFDVVAIGYVLATIALALRYRDFSTINAKYMYPGILAFIFLFIEGAGAFYKFLSSRTRWITILFEVALFLLIVAYSMDTYHMIVHLYSIL